ncbi:molybdopterin-dependent oxidoreductase alpha subunit [Allocatelliglobosispora scoriae]|uniref:Molybdopterin-dependent oxidoreductase alpha subunit n=1 Tax=Allocatelliglobosispora scoriae TaxID=643052 RepID=A0A841BTF2_9ACTN|nr:FdhF/YdeP family oxidoreductase [Allocatelliglobosispora scoriae]MBB5870696.1 molybdopterin-dependent oxidoreductase alpha subunit [Allocatelliglobosispora scoriae]
MAKKLRVGDPKKSAAGLPGVGHGLAAGLTQMGVRRTALTLLKINQPGGFDCPGCAWPEPGPEQRSHAEFCENGAKAVAEEATLRRVTPEFFAEHAIADLATQTDHWLGKQGRITTPMIKFPGSAHYAPIAWDDAFGLVARSLAAHEPDRAVFYTSGRTSNEAAFLYQLLARAHGTNNLPDCSNMCHESSGAALISTIGIGKGTVTLDDVHAARLIVVVGQNPGTNHPRMLTALEHAKRNGARIIAVNPLPEAGLMRFKNPQKLSGLAGRGTALADLHLQIRVGGDLALFQAIGSLLIEAGSADTSFIESSTAGYDAYRTHLGELDWAAVLTATGLTRAEIETATKLFAQSSATIVCWAMGLTQGRDAVATIREVVNVQLLRGMIGKKGAGLCPVRGHSNVQGDRTMGIWHEPPSWLPRLADATGVAMPAERGLDTVEAIRAMRDGEIKVFMALGGNFAAASPDSDVTEAALRNVDLTVHVSTKLNRSHVIAGDEQTSLILPCLGRTERDVQATGEQFVTVEDSMSNVHSSQGNLPPASPLLLSEVAIVSRLGALIAPTLPWSTWTADYRTVRELIATSVPGFDGFEAKVATPGGFTLPHPPRDSRSFPTADGLAHFTVSPIAPVEVPPGRLLLQTLRSHDQYNTTIYGLDDRYRGITGGRRVVFVNPDDLAELGLRDGEIVDIVSEWADTERRAPRFRIVSYDTARGCAAAYFPEANVLVPLDSTAAESNTPTSKQIIVRLERAALDAVSSGAVSSDAVSLDAAS